MVQTWRKSREFLIRAMSRKTKRYLMNAISPHDTRKAEYLLKHKTFEKQVVGNRSWNQLAAPDAATSASLKILEYKISAPLLAAKNWRRLDFGDGTLQKLCNMLQHSAYTARRRASQMQANDAWNMTCHVDSTTTLHPGSQHSVPLHCLICIMGRCRSTSAPGLGAR